MRLPTIDFRSIREHLGAKSGGFEELVYQLIPWIDQEVAEREVVRHGTPDGGVEAHVAFDDGSMWGWQAKYFEKIDDSQVQQMKESLESALKSYPTLSRYTFVIPLNPPSGRRTGAKSAKQKLDDAFARWESEAAADGHTVNIRLVDESQLLRILVGEEHTGRVLYWFDKRLLFGTRWLSQKLQESIAAAGPRYTPNVNVELPLAFAFEGLGRTNAFDGRLSEALAAVGGATGRFQPPRQDSGLTENLRADMAGVADRAETLLEQFAVTPVVGAEPLRWEAQLSQVAEFQDALFPLHVELLDRVRSLQEKDPGQSRTGASKPWEVVQGLKEEAVHVRHALADLEDFLRSPAARLAATPLLFLSGDAGTGKTHLLCDIADRRIKEGRPTVLVMGQQLGEGNPRTLVLDQLGLADMSMEEFLGALNTAGEVAGTRALLIVDAINEGGGLASWPPHLRSLADEVATYPHLGLVLSCRSSYVEAMLDGESGLSEPQPSDIGYVEVKHIGFAGSEWKAARRFFDYYGMKLPDFPLLVPEYTNPLFLKLLCESLSKAGEDTLPRGATGITALFKRFLSEANRSLARPGRCNFRRKDELVFRAVAEIARTMLSAGEDWIPFTEFRRICDEVLPGREWDESLAKGLIDEGVVIEDVLDRKGVARLSYQRLGDHLQAADLLRTKDVDATRAFLADLENDYAGFTLRSGLLEALAVQLPEELGCELHELVTERGHDAIQDAFLKSIVWRNPEFFPDDLALDYLNSIIEGRSSWYDDPVLDKLLQVACVPDHPFNAERLDQTLARTPLADRDAWWTTYINTCSREDSVVYRIIDWARSPEQQAVADDAARLAAITLTWFLTASNRHLRDCATKALVALLHGRIPVLVDLLGHFNSIDDPYITERLYAVAYGCALSTTDSEALKALTSTVYEEVFVDGEPPVHIILRDYARGVIEVAVERHVAPSDVDLGLVCPPYKSSWPVRIPTQDQLDRRAPLELTGNCIHRSQACSGTSLGTRWAMP